MIIKIIIIISFACTVEVNIIKVNISFDIFKLNMDQQDFLVTIYTLNH